jgi:ABC-type transport system involved in multi-copper enzyme maturation permease subunit
MINLVKAEFRKVFSTRMWIGLTAGGAALVAFYTIVIAFTAGTASAGPNGFKSLADPGTVRAVYGVPFEVGYLIPIVFGVILICGEYRHKTITPTFLVTPKRSPVLLAKIVVAGIVGAGMGVLYSIESAAIGAAIIAGRGYPVLLGSNGIPRMLVLMAVGLGVWAVFGLGFGALLRNQIAAVITALAIVAILEGLLTLALRWAHLGTVAKLLPSNAAAAIVQPSTVKAGDLLSWWSGGLTLLAWGLVTVLLGTMITQRRDVT